MHTVNRLQRILRERLGDDRGSGGLHLAIAAPALLLLVFAGIQAYQIDQARYLALAAAQQGVDSARAYGADSDAGTLRAQRFLDRVGSEDLRTMNIAVHDDGARVTVTVTGSPRTVFGGWITINRTWTGAKERFTTGDEP